MLDAKPVKTLLAAHFRLSADLFSQTDEEKKYMFHVSYASVVGSIMYATVYIRPDISHAVSIVSRYMDMPGKGHWQTVK